MKLGLLGSTETHGGTRWAPNWASRYAKPRRENLNSPKSIAIRDDRSSSTIAIRALEGLRQTRSIIYHLERFGTAVEAIPEVLEAIHLCSIDIQTPRRPLRSISYAYNDA
ncbi:hypothetical protein E3N88_29999 [Mikania micrantha]|uniref:Uncharacterized protein n=1 Tax=Mikania micrantha TaxID=192012 RepID=A0A5N6ML15_9ASTR|nr:hypothetical protein E3N88_29999 [Mikania micrantha]